MTAGLVCVLLAATMLSACKKEDTTAIVSESDGVSANSTVTAETPAAEVPQVDRTEVTIAGKKYLKDINGNFYDFETKDIIPFDGGGSRWVLSEGKYLVRWDGTLLIRKNTAALGSLTPLITTSG